MRRLLRIAMLMAGLLWLAPAVRALPLGVDEAEPTGAALAAAEESAELAAAAPLPRAARSVVPDATARAGAARAGSRGISTLLYVGLLGLLILGADRRIVAEALRDAFTRPARRAPEHAAAKPEARAPAEAIR